MNRVIANAHALWPNKKSEFASVNSEKYGLSSLNDRYFFLRLIPIAILGFACALALTWFMNMLIQTGKQQLDESDRVHFIDFVRVKRSESSQRDRQRPDRPSQADVPPAPPVSPNNASADASASSISIEMPAGNTMTSRLDGIGIGHHDGEYLPIIKVAPEYPRRAASQGIEGECAVIYTVTANGSVRDVEVIPSMCSQTVFFAPSIRAAGKFKYKPRVIDGEAVEVEGIINNFIYALEKNQENHE